VTLKSDLVHGNAADGGNGGGLDIASGATVYIDSFTVNNTINNVGGFNNSPDNNDGTYIVKN
jgi:hypothetical protein